MFCLLAIAAAVTVRRVDENGVLGAETDVLNASDVETMHEVEEIDSLLLEPIRPARTEEIAFAELTSAFDPARTSVWSKKLAPQKKKLGAGAFGTVYLVSPKCDASKKYALKVQRPQSPRDTHWPKEMNSEVKLMLKFNSPLFVQILDYGFGKSKTGQQHSILMEAADSDLGKYTSVDNKWDQVVVFMTDLLEGIAEMHAAGVVHRDLKPGNVLVKCVGAMCHAKIADLGMSCIIGGPDCSGIGGTPLYFAPELLKTKGPAQSNDMWGMGVMMYELLFRTVPTGISGRTLEQLYANIKKMKDTHYVTVEMVGARMKGAPADVVSKAYKLLIALLQPTSASRISAKAAASAARDMMAGIKVAPLPPAALPACWDVEAAEPEPEPEPAKKDKGVIASVKDAIKSVLPFSKSGKNPVPEPMEEEDKNSAVGDDDYIAVNKPKTNMAAALVLKWAKGMPLAEIQKTAKQYLPKGLSTGKFELISINGYKPEQIKGDSELHDGLKDGVHGNLVVHVKVVSK